jgi:hypothetical protein
MIELLKVEKVSEKPKQNFDPVWRAPGGLGLPIPS